LATLQDLDYNKAISDLNRQTTSLQAAQKSFKQVAELSMFNYM
jgi:flagellar hook-associated protein 3 FlgL